MMPTRSRDEHLAWAKQRALKYLDSGDLANAYTSMASDLRKHPELHYKEEVLDHLALTYLINHDAHGLRRWIEGFQ